MGALTIAFDITIVGALALPWVLLVIHLFFFDGENRLEEIVDLVTVQGRQAVAGVLLFAMTYTLGSAVSRMAKDFFNDDDLYVQARWLLLRVGVTEDRIVASVYCNDKKNNLLPADAENPSIAKKGTAFRTEATPDGCQRTLRWSELHKYDAEDDRLIEAARDLFGLQENALLLKGEDATLRLRQLHDQIMVLRGAAFDGLIGFSLCVFAWGAKLMGVKFARHQPHYWLRLALVVAPAIFLAVGLLATEHHFAERAPSDPPYMEFTLILLGLAGAWLVWKPRPAQNQAGANQAGANQAGANQTQVDKSRTDEARVEKTGGGNAEKKKYNWKIENWPRLVLLSAILSTAAILAWWSTEVMYVEQVIYSYDSQLHQAQGAVAPQK